VVAFHYDGNAMQLLDDDVKTSPGLEFVGPGHYFISYSTLEQTMKFGSLTGRTSDGLKITVSFEFQYLYDTHKDSLLALYYKFGNRKDKQDRMFKNVARWAALDALSQFSAYEANEQKEALGTALQNRIDAKLQHYFKSSITQLQLSGVVLPDAIANAIIETQSVKENINAAVNAKETAKVTAQTEIYNAELDAEVTLYAGEATASATITTATAEASAIITQYKAEADAYKVLYEELQQHYGAAEFTTTDMLNYIWLESLGEVNEGAAVFNVDKPNTLTYGAGV
jgi:regulator of protease activity HflC (stomatin/prohibitin superfamily)